MNRQVQAWPLSQTCVQHTHARNTYVVFGPKRLSMSGNFLFHLGDAQAADGNRALLIALPTNNGAVHHASLLQIKHSALRL